MRKSTNNGDAKIVPAKIVPAKIYPAKIVPAKTGNKQATPPAIVTKLTRIVVENVTKTRRMKSPKWKRKSSRTKNLRP